MACSPKLSPVPYAQWNGQALFPAGTRPTVTHITSNGPLNAGGLRCAYGWDSDDNKCFYFYVTFATQAEEDSFKNRDWAAWRAQDPTCPHLLATDPPTDPPPGCGTPWTDTCGDPQLVTTPTPTPGRGRGRGPNPNAPGGSGL